MIFFFLSLSIVDLIVEILCMVELLCYDGYFVKFVDFNFEGFDLILSVNKGYFGLHCFCLRNIISENVICWC